MLSFRVLVKGDFYNVKCLWISPNLPTERDTTIKHETASIRITSIKNNAGDELIDDDDLKRQVKKIVKRKVDRILGKLK